MSYVHLCVTPTTDQWFRVSPFLIDRTLFEKERRDGREEIVRKMILLAFMQVDRFPKTYSTFYTMFPEKKWDKMQVKELERLARQLGEGVATITQQALEWAQRISNGETWEKLCSMPDEAEYYRLVKWYVGDGLKKIGGARILNNESPAVDVYHMSHCMEDVLSDSVPLIFKHFD